MATSSLVLKDVEDQLTCPICLSLFEEPKVLTCHHVFCANCLIKCTVKNGQGQSMVRCSACRAETPVPTGGVRKLEVAFSVNKLFDTHAKLLTTVTCSKEYTHDSKKCKMHPQRERELWCATCSILICFQCSLEEEVHHNHKYYLASKLSQQAKCELQSSLDSLMQQHAGFNVALKDLDDHVEKLYKKKDIAEREIHEAAASIRKEISTREMDAVGKLYAMVDERVVKVSLYRDKLELRSSQFQDCIKQFQSKLERDDPCELVGIKSELCEKASGLCQSLQPEAFLTLDETGEPEFYVDQSEIKQTFQKKFFVYTCDVCPSNCQAAGEGLSSALVGEKNSFLFRAFTSSGDPCKNPVQGLCCRLMSDLMGDSIDLTKMEQSTTSFVFSYIPTHKGWHTLRIELKGKHIAGSPFRVAVLSKGWKYLKLHHCIKTAPHPEAMVVSNARVITSSPSSLTVTTGNRENEINLFKGSKISILALRRGCTFFAVDSQSMNYVLELDISTGKKRDIMRFPQEIADIAFSCIYNSLFVLLNGPNVGRPGYVEIASLNANPEKSVSFGSAGHGRGQLNSPKAIAVDEESNRVFIADTYNNRIQVFSCKGKYLNKFGAKGWDTFCKPAVLTVAWEKLFVGETNTVYVFDINGFHLCSVEHQSIGRIVSLAVDECGILYICDHKNSQVLLF